MGKHILLLPDIALQKPRMIGHAIKDFSRRHAKAFQLTAELDRSSHSVCPLLLRDPKAAPAKRFQQEGIEKI